MECISNAFCAQNNQYHSPPLSSYLRTVLPINNSVPIENVVVAESGDDSEDEWDYIKGDKDKQPEHEPTAFSAGIEHDTDLLLAKNQHFGEPNPFATSAESPAASLFDADLIAPSHAVSQAFVEPEEACVEVSIASPHRLRPS